MLQRFTTQIKNGKISSTSYLSSTILNFLGFASGTFYVYTIVGSGTTVTWYASPDGVVWAPLYDNTNTVVAQTINASLVAAYQFPSACFGCGYLAAQVATADLPCHFTLKA